MEPEVETDAELVQPERPAVKTWEAQARVKFGGATYDVGQRFEAMDEQVGVLAERGFIRQAGPAEEE